MVGRGKKFISQCISLRSGMGSFRAGETGKDIGVGKKRGKGRIFGVGKFGVEYRDGGEWWRGKGGALVVVRGEVRD